MSLYIGNNAAEKVLHIYNGSTSIEKVPFAGTSFHSSLPYATFVSVHRFLPSGAPYVTQSSTYVYSDRQNYSTISPLPSGDYSIIIRGEYGGNIYTFPTSVGEGYFSAIQAIYFGSPLANAPAFRLDNLSSGHLDRCSFPGGTLFGIQAFSWLDIYVFNESISQTPASDIVINKNNILINGISITSRVYVHMMSTIADRLNDYDTIIPVPIGGSYRGLVYSTSSNNITHSANGNYHLIQLVNSYSYSVSSLEITSNPTAISVNKNNMLLKMFDADIKFKTSVSYVGTHRILSYGQSCGAGTTYLSTLFFSIGTNVTILLNLLLSKSGFSTIKDIFAPIQIVSGYSITVMSSYQYYIYGSVPVSLDRIDFYVYCGSSLSFVTNIDCNVYRLV